MIRSRSGSVAQSVLFLLFASAIACLNQPATLAQIVPDASVGGERSNIQRDVLVNGARVDQIEGGSRRGGNLFHSFETFNVANGQRVYFASPDGVERIFSRVTGTSRSEIRGTLGVAGRADLFLLNPNGILFGRNARLDIRGSFVASSASAIEFGDRGVFSTDLVQPPSPLLTIQPTALLLNSQAQPIVSRSLVSDASGIVGLQVPAGRSLLLIGGDVRLSEGVLTAAGGVVELAAAQGTVSLLPVGQIWRIQPPTLVQGDVVLENESGIVVESANRGSVSLYGESIALRGRSGIAAGIAVGRGTSASQAGNVTLNATRAIHIQDSIVANVVGTEGRGNSGNIRLQAETITLSDGSGIQTLARSQGNSGDIQITTGSLSLVSGAGLLASTGDRGNAGNIRIQARNAVTLDQSVVLSTVDVGAIGRGGSIGITAGSLAITGGASLFAATFGTGTAGDIDLDIGGQIQLDGSNEQGNYSLIASLLENGGQGRAGNIRIQANSMSLTNGGAIISSTEGQGDAGNIRVLIADRLEMGELAADGTASAILAIVAETAVGNGGDIFVTADELDMTQSAIAASSGGQGNAGNVEIAARSVRLNDAIIASTGLTENGGNVTFRDLDFLLLDNGAVITAAARLTGARGNGGNVSIDSDLIVAVPNEDNDIAANTEGGRGGNIDITTQGIFGIESRPERSPLTNDINASSRLNVDGTVTINTPIVDPVAGTVNLPTDFSSPPLSQNCEAQGSRGRFVNTGRGGLPTNPADPLVVEELWQDLGESEFAAIESPQAIEPPSLPSVTLIEAQGWIVSPEGNVTLTAAAPTATPHGIGTVTECDPVLAHE
jgi:filamentous hemagglutinin family protein